MEYYSAINEMKSFIETWMVLEINILNEISEMKTNTMM